MFRKMFDETVLEFTGVDLVRDGRPILSRIGWQVRRNDRWIVLGPNGSGKTSLCRIAGLYSHPSRGCVKVLGHRVGHTDVRTLRAKVGLTSHALADMIRPGLPAADVVATGKNAALAPRWHQYTGEDRRRASDLLTQFGCQELADARFETLSSGERQRVLLARTLMSNPSLLLLDEPAAGLDLAGLEQLVAQLARVAADDGSPATVLVTHHVDEIPPCFTHVLMLSTGHVVAQGPLDKMLTSDRLSDCFGLSLNLEQREGRWMAWGS